MTYRQKKVEIYVGEIGSAIPPVAKPSYTPMPLSHAPLLLGEEDNVTQRQQESRERCSKLLQSLGWGTGFRIPFATKENRQLEFDLEFKQRKVLALRTELQDNLQHAKALEQSTAKMAEVIVSQQNLFLARKSLLEEDRNFLGLAERIQSRIRQEKLKTDNDLKECLQRCEIMKACALTDSKDMDRRLKGVLELRDLIDFDSKALDEYHIRLQEYEEDSGEVKKICLEDDKRIRELEDSRVELGAKRKELRFELDQEAMNTSKFQEQFDRLSIEFRKTHRQRTEMISMWSATIQAMNGKDDHMKEIADEYYETRKLMRRVGETIKYKEMRLRVETCSIRGTEMLLSELDRQRGEICRRIEEEKDLVSTLKDACSLCQMEVTHSAGQTKERIEGLQKLEAEIKALEDKRLRSSAIVAQLKEKLKAIEHGRTNADIRMGELEKILDNEERAAESLIRDMELIRKFFWEISNDKSVTESEIHNMETTVVRLQNSLAIMQSKEVLNMDFIAKRSGNIYRLDLECSILENRISKMMNQSIDPKYFDLQNTVVELREVGNKLDKEKKYISSELEHVENITYKCNADFGKNRREERSLESDLRQCDMLTHGLNKRMNQAIKMLNDEQVHYSLERVYLKRLTDELKSERQNIYGLAEIRNTIHWAVKERKAEIENHRLLNSSRQKALSDTVTKLRVQALEVKNRTEKLRGRFDLVTKLMAGSNDVNPEERTLAYQVRKAARERETLQIEVQKWRVRVEEAAHELEGLSNVTHIMQASNSSLKGSLAPAEDNSQELKDLQELNEREKEILLRRNRAKKYRAILQDRLVDLNEQSTEVEQEVQAINQLCQMKEALNTKVQNELHTQKDKVIRWSGMCSRILREIKDLIPQEKFELMQKDLKLRFIISKFESAVGMLERIITQYPYLKTFINPFLREDSNLIKLYYRFNKISPPSNTNLTASSSYSYFTYNTSTLQADTQWKSKSNDNSGSEFSIDQLNSQSQLQHQKKSSESFYSPSTTNTQTVSWAKQAGSGSSPSSRRDLQ